MASQPTSDKYQTAERSARVVRGLQAGARLVWYPVGGYRLELGKEQAYRVRWYVAAALRKAGTITTDDHDLTQPRVWRLVTEQNA